MNRISTTLTALMMTASVGAWAQTTTDTTREQRMNSALQDYRDGGSTSRNASSGNSTGNSGNSGNGRFARTEDSVKSGTRKAGHAVGEGARSGGHAVAQGARKTGHAIRNATPKAKNSADNTAP